MLNIWTSRSKQTVQTQIKLLLEEQFDQSLLFATLSVLLDTSNGCQTDLVKIYVNDSAKLIPIIFGN